MTVRPIAPADLPAASASNLAGLRALHLWSRNTPTETRLQLRGLGEIRIALEKMADTAAAIAPEDAVFGIERGGRWGRIAVDGWLALRLVSATLGRAPDLTLRGLGRSERGVLAALLASVLQQIAPELRLSLGAAPRASADCVTAVVKVDVMSNAATVRLDLPLSWLPDEDRPGGVPFDGSALPVSGCLELASTCLPAAELATLRPGDAVVFDGFVAAAKAGVWDTRLRVGRYVAATRLDVDGGVHVVDGFHPAAAATRHSVQVSSQQEPAMSNASTPTSPNSGTLPTGAPVDATVVLAAAPVEVVVEIGRIVLRGDELLGLAKGHVLTLGGARTTNVSLRVGDAVWASGELVDVDGELGVRVVEVFRR